MKMIIGNKCVDCKIDISDKRSNAKRCNVCYNKYRKEYFAIYRKTPKSKETVKRANETPETRARKRIYNKSEKGRKAHLKYRRSEKGKTSLRAQVLKRRARIAKVDGNLSALDIRKVKNHFDRCVYCGEKESLELEHIDPISKGGNNDKWNVVLACRACNMNKFNKPLEIWFKENPEKKEHFWNYVKTLDATNF